MARTNRTNRMRLGELLVAAGLVTEDKVRAGLEEQRRNNLFLGEALVRLGFVSEEAIAHAIIQHFNLPFLSASQFTIPPDVFNLFPERMYHEYQFIAGDKIDNVIIIIAAGPINQDMMEELERVSGCKICHYVSTWKDIQSAIQRNSQELGGQTQIELTGLGSMLLDGPPRPSGNVVGLSAATGPSISSIFRPGESLRLPGGNNSHSSPRTAMVPRSKILNAANLSALISPLSQRGPLSQSAPDAAQASASVPPSPRLTAFLKQPGHSQSSPSQTGMPSVPSISSPSLQAYTRSSERLAATQNNINSGASNGALAAVAYPGTRPIPQAPQVPGFQARNNMPQAPGPNTSGITEIPDDPAAPPRPKRLSSFTNLRKPT